MKEEQQKMERVKQWFNEGRDSGFSDKQLDFLKDNFAFWGEVPKTLEDLII